MKVLLVFLDGVGIGPADPAVNPFFQARLPVLKQLLGGSLPSLDGLPPTSKDAAGRPPIPGPEPASNGGSTTAGPRTPDREAVAFAVDATLGTDGTPQSGTGQTALLTGTDAPRRFGRHFGPWVPVALRPLVEEESVLRRALGAGATAAFANAYPRDWPGRAGSRWVAAPPLAARAAGLLVRHADALRRGEAVASGIVNDGWRTGLGHADLPTPTPREAGRNLARIATGAGLTLFAHYATDHAGHEADIDGCVRALERVDAFLGGVLEDLSRDHLLLVTSDHGNIEDVRGGHTTNPALGLLAGPGARERSRRIESLVDVTPAVLEWLGE